MLSRELRRIRTISKSRPGGSLKSRRSRKSRVGERERPRPNPTRLSRGSKSRSRRPQSRSMSRRNGGASRGSRKSRSRSRSRRSRSRSRKSPRPYPRPRPVLKPPPRGESTRARGPRGGSLLNEGLPSSGPRRPAGGRRSPKRGGERSRGLNPDDGGNRDDITRSCHQEMTGW